MHGRDEVLRLLAAGVLRVDEAAELLDRASTASTVELEVRRATDSATLLRAILPTAFVDAAAAAGLRLVLRVGEPPLAIAWRELVEQLEQRAWVEVRDEVAGVVARLRIASGSDKA